MRTMSSVATGGQSATHNLTFSYDRWGNMACQTNLQTNGPCPNWTFNTTSNQISTAGFTYDAAGNLTSDGVHTYQWDAEARLKSVDNGTTATYYYNALGQRVQKQPGSGLPADYRYYYYDASGQLISMLSQTTQLDHFLPRLGGRLWGEWGGYFFHPNALGSTGMVMTTYGLWNQYGVLTDELYYRWGQRWQAIGNMWWDRFASLERRDADTGLDSTLFRMYASTQGRWLSPDPLAGDILNPQSLNRYAYVANNPSNRIDPLGLLSSIFCGFGCTGSFQGRIFRDYINNATLDRFERDFRSEGVSRRDPGHADPSRGRGDPGDSVTANQAPVLVAQANPTPAPQNQTPIGPAPNPGPAPTPATTPCFGGDAFCNSAGQVVRVNGNIGSDNAANMAMAGAAYAAWDVSMVQAGRLFGTGWRGNAPVFNSADAFRIGWSFDHDSGQYVFRIGGESLKRFLKNPHINLWPPSWWGGKP